jgi:hypothetical protein
MELISLKDGVYMHAKITREIKNYIDATAAVHGFNKNIVLNSLLVAGLKGVKMAKKKGKGGKGGGKKSC